MSDEPEINVVTRLVPGLTIICLLIMIASALFHVVTLTPPEKPSFDRSDAPAAPDYATAAAWLARPNDEMPGGWEKPWGLDLIWFVDQPDGYLGGWNIPLDWAGTDSQLSGEEWLYPESDEAYGFYAPGRRHSASLSGDETDLKSAQALETEDVLKAADFYLETDNKSRGIFLGGQGSGVQAALTVFEQRIADTRPYSEIFGGLIISSNSTGNEIGDLPPWPDCAETIADYPCVLDLRTVGDSELAAEEIERTFERFSAWLDTNVTKPAAPLPPFETIELAPIRRPGEIE